MAHPERSGLGRSTEQVPAALREDVEQIFSLTDQFWSELLDDEYSGLCRRLMHPRVNSINMSHAASLRLASYFQTNGLALPLRSSMKAMILSTRSSREANSPRFKSLRVRMLKTNSTWLSQLACLGV